MDIFCSPATEVGFWSVILIIDERIVYFEVKAPCLTSFEAVLSSSSKVLKVVVRGVKDNNGVDEANNEGIEVRLCDGEE